MLRIHCPKVNINILFTSTYRSHEHNIIHVITYLLGFMNSFKEVIRVFSFLPTESWFIAQTCYNPFNIMDELLVAFYVVIFLGSGGLNKLLGSSSKVILSLIMSS